MAYQQHATLGVDHRALRPERQPAPHAPDGPEQRCQQPVRHEPSEQATLWSCAFLRHDLLRYFFFAALLAGALAAAGCGVGGPGCTDRPNTRQRPSTA